MFLLRTTLGSTLILLLAAAGLVCAQDYPIAVVDCHKIHPGKAAEFEKLQKEVIRPWQQARADKEEIVSWSLQSASFPSGADAPCNYVAILIHSSMKGFGALAPQVASWNRAALPKTHSEYIAAYSALATYRNRQLWRVLGAGGNGEPGQWVRWTYSKRNDLPAFVDAYQKHLPPVKELQVKEGKLKAYAQLTLSMDDGSPYNSVLLSTVSDLVDSQIRPYSSNADLLKKHFNKDHDALFEKSIPVRSEVYRIVEFVRPARSVPASGGAK